MNFVVSSTSLLSHLQAIGRVISSKNTMPILDCIVFDVKDGKIKITASDLETTLTSEILPDSISEEGRVAIPAKIILEIVKKFPEQPLSFEINLNTFAIRILSDNGEYTLVGFDADEFPNTEMQTEGKSVKFSTTCSLLLDGINKTFFATASDELRPVMNCIFVEISSSNLNFVASDAHKLVRYKRFDANTDVEDESFILPKKPASLLKNILPKKEDVLSVEYTNKRAIFNFGTYTLSCKLVEGKFPNYNSVIPQNNPNKVIIDRDSILGTLGRVAVVSNPASSLVKLELGQNKLVVSAQDVDFSTSGHETLACQYEGPEFSIGFKAPYMQEIISNIDASNIVIELSDPTRPGLFLPYDSENADEDVLMLLMPMMIN
ncbi:MAG: DNA polymerase III subunit beta [Marinifilaceae bacterium]|jgi:DNA polymerase-3 subunit beta